MIKTLFFLVSALLLPGLAFGDTPSANLSVTVVPAAQSSPSAQCPSTPPAAAQRAGYTAMVFCNDFTQPIPNSAGTGTPGGPTTWAQGCGGPGNSIWYAQTQTNWDCSEQGQATDPATGTLAMHLVATQSRGNPRVVLVTDDGQDHRPGFGNYFNFPQASYLVIRYRDNMEDSSQSCDGIATDFFEWSHEGGAGSTAVNEFDLIENWDAGSGCSPWNYGGAIHNWNNGTAGPMWGYNWCLGMTWPPGSTANTCPGYLTSGNGGKPTSVYHSYGMLITVQSGNNISACGYVDDVLINCGGMIYPETECTGTGGSGGTAALNQSGCWGQRSIALLWVGSINGQNLNRDIHAYIQSWQAWSCPSWNAGSATISNPGVNTCYGPLISSENAPRGEKDRLLAMSDSDRQYVLSKMNPEIRAHWAEQGVN